MTYHAITLQVPSESQDAVLTRIYSLGAVGSGEQDDMIKVYFEGDLDLSKLHAELDRLKQDLAEAGLDPGFSWKHELLPSQDWNEIWKRGFSPIDIGKRLTIVPSWVEHDTERIPVIVDPCTVFGTGHHETTRACLACIENLADRYPGGTFLDVGTGTGILAIAAARLGFRSVTGVDIDTSAVAAAHRNVELNGLSNVVIREGTISDIGESFDVIAANLLSGILVASSGEIARYLNSAGRAVLSGMLEGEEATVAEALRNAGLEVTEFLRDGRWMTILAGH